MKSMHKKILLSILFLGILFFAHGSSAQTVPPTVLTVDLHTGSADTDSGGQVSQLQRFLVQANYLVMPPGVSTGYFGQLTGSSVISFQQANDISPAAGFVGPITRASIAAFSYSTSVNPSLPPGCTSTSAFSMTTGKLCQAKTISTTPPNTAPLSPQKPSPTPVPPPTPIPPPVSVQTTSPSSSSCDITDIVSLKSCFNNADSYNTFNFKKDLSCSGGNCCTNQYGLMQLNSVSGKTINGNGHTLTRHTNQRECAALRVTSSSNVNVSNLNFDEDELVSPCAPNDNCPETIGVYNSSNTNFDTVRVYNGKAYVFKVWGDNGFTLTNSTISNAGIIGLYVGNTFLAPSSNVRLSNNIFARARTNGLAIEGVGGTNTIDHNVFTQNHYHGLWLTQNTAPTFGAPTSGGEVFLDAQANNIEFTDNIISNGHCENCWGGGEIEGIELGDLRGPAANSLSMARNVFMNIFGWGIALNPGTILGNDVTATNNLIRRVTTPSNLSSSVFYNNMVTDSAGPNETTNNIYRIGFPNLGLLHESPRSIDPGGNEVGVGGIFGLSASPRLGASEKPLFRCFVTGTQDDFVSSDYRCGGQTLDAVLGFSYESTYPRAQKFYACLAGTADHFISWLPGCEGQSVGKLLGYAVSDSGASNLPPTASLTINNSHDLTANVGGSITYHWSSTNGQAFSSTFTNSCTPGVIKNWVANSASGDQGVAAIAPGYAGCTEVYTYKVTGIDGSIATDIATIRVNH